MTDMNVCEKRLYRAAKKASNIFVDFFDTLVHRDVHPDTIKQLWAIQVSKNIDGLSARELYETRISSEAFVGRIHPHYQYEKLVDEVIKRIVNEKALALDINELSQKMEQTECEIEKKHLQIDQAMHDFLCKSKVEVKKIFIVSDFYMGKDVLSDYLQTVGYEESFFDDIFVSCDCKCSKADSTLYPYVVKQIKCNAGECLMIGDHRRSDCLKAKQCGLKAVHIPYKNKTAPKSLQALKQSLQEISKREMSSFYDYYAFSLYYFTAQLYHHMQKEQTQDIYFFAREGWFLKEMFDRYLAVVGNSTISTHYLYISRRAAYLPSLCPLDEEMFSPLFSERTVSYSCESFLDNLNFTSADKRQIQNDLLLDREGFQRTYEDFAATETYHNMRRSGIFREIYEKRRRDAKQLLSDYLRQNGISAESHTVVLVDVGWKGSMQDFIHQFLGNNVHIIGYYLGLEELTNVDIRSQKRGVLYSKISISSSFQRQWTFNRLIYEDVLHAPHPSTKEYAREGGLVVPVFDRAENPMLNTYAEQIQSRIMQFFEKQCELFRDTVYHPTDVESTYVAMMVKAIAHITGKDLQIYNCMNEEHYNNFIVLSTVKEQRSYYDCKKIFAKAKRYLRKLETVFSGDLAIKFTALLYRYHMRLCSYLYRQIVCSIERKKLP